MPAHLNTAPAFDLARVLPGFTHLRRFKEPSTGQMSVKILPGEFYASRQDEVITTVLGSCIAACIQDPEAGIGGMNHFMLPEPSNNGGNWGDSAGRSARYGSEAMEQLINALIKAGGTKNRMKVKIFGGGRVLTQMTDIGQRNIEFVRRYLQTEGLPVVAEDVGGVQGRQVRFYPLTGRTQVRKLGSATDPDVIEREKRYLKELEKAPIQGGVELF